MEKRILLAIVLSFLVLVLYQAIFVKKPQPQETPPEIPSPAETRPKKEVSPQPPPPEPSPETELPAEKKMEKPLSEESEQHILIETSLYQAVWNNKGAVLENWRLKKHKDDEGENLELVSRRSQEIDRYPFCLKTEDSAFDRTINNALYQFSDRKLELWDGQKGELRFQYADGEGTRVEKVFIFQDGKYTFDVKINVWKNNQRIDHQLLWGPSLRNPTPEEKERRFGADSGVAVLAGSKIYRQKEIKYKPEESVFHFVTWAAYEDNYFTALFLTSTQKSTAFFLKEESEQAPSFFLALTHPQKAFLGPKDYDALEEFAPKAKDLIKFGFFGWIAQILLKAIKFVHSFIPNWGFSIIILTLIIKILFFPLTYSSTRSMAKMQELQPKIKALRAKYKKAKKDIAQRRKMNEEMMKLYKEHGINPAGGCLPMLIQIPIFWGFFRLLVVSIEFRHSPFILWINDLSLKDPYYVTPILMGISQYISQKLTPTSADPTQQKMMLIMPVIMVIFFMNFQSGLVLYWLTNNILQIGQQVIMNRLMKKKKRESHGSKKRRK
ncbi:MAG: membrane protein insertase YidC [Candidatus Aminicenantes bacterium]